MKKITDKSNIKRRLIALLTIAVFVFVMGFYPVNIVSATDMDESESIESTEAIQDMEVAGNTEDLDAAYEEDRGYIDDPEIRELLTVKKSEEPAYLKKEEERLEKTLEDVYDPREMPYYKDRVAMFDQRPTGTCWAHCIATTAQVSYLKELYTNSSLGDENYQLAPRDFAYNFYNRVPYEKYGYTAEDKNIPAAGNDWTNNGGNNLMSSLALFGWMGLHSIKNESQEDSNAYNNSLVLQNARLFNDIEKQAQVGGEDYKFCVLNQPLIKQAIKDYGAVAVSINMKDYYNNFSDEEDTRTWRGNRFNSYNCDYSVESDNGDTGKIGSVNHGVTLIGWDDDFPKEYFTKQPQSDGAWIMQNSKGTENGPGQGFWYVSYEDFSLRSAAALDMQPADTYDANYQYDGTANPRSTGFGMGVQFANVFTVPDDEVGNSVEAVGFVTYNNYLTKYKVSIYKGVSTEPTSGTLAATIDVQTDVPGCFTFNLLENGASPVNVAAGEKFSVIVEATETSGDEDKFYIGYERSDEMADFKFTSLGKENTSFYKRPGSSTWEDVFASNQSGSFRIKAFATELNVKESWITLPQSNYNYTGKSIKPEPIVKCNGQELIKDTDYTVSYGKNKYPGKGTVTVTGMGLYKGYATIKFNIAGVNNFRQTAATKKTATLKWDKSPKVKGYKIYRLKKGKFKLIKTLKKNSKVKFTDKKLKAGTEYQYKIRTYKKIGKKTYYGPLSDVLVVRTK